MEKILDCLKKIKPTVNFSEATDIVGQGLLSSLDIMNLVTVLNQSFGIRIGITELRPENFKTIRTIQQMVERLQTKE